MLHEYRCQILGRHKTLAFMSILSTFQIQAFWLWLGPIRAVIGAFTCSHTRLHHVWPISWSNYIVHMIFRPNPKLAAHNRGVIVPRPVWRIRWYGRCVMTVCHQIDETWSNRAWEHFGTPSEGCDSWIPTDPLKVQLLTKSTFFMTT